ncbi:MAG: quinol:electron acceptor oxidoreductase subunit ActD [Planctomycetota bacterium]
MADQTKNDELHGVVAYFDDVDSVMAAARKIRDAGYKKWDTYTPFPVHGIDEAMGTKPTVLPWIVLAMGLTGLSLAILMQWWMNAVDYEFMISGKPSWSLPANIPVAFEMTILFSAFTAFFAMLGLNKLPTLSNPLHRLDKFARVTNDRFAICVEAADPNFDAARIRTLLGTHSSDIEDCPVDTSPAALPLWFHGVMALLTCLTFIPLAIAFKGRFATSEKPRYHVWPDMDWQPKRKAQTDWEGFEDGRAMRPPVAGAIPRGELRDDLEFYFGVAQGTKVPDKVTYDVGTMGDKDGEEQYEWLLAYPSAVVVDDALLERGRERYGIYCAVCHGAQGNGMGAVAVRANELGAEKWGWVQPKALHSDNAKAYRNGELFHVVTNGISSMRGYGSQIDPQDRWAIVAYVRALQKTQSLESRPDWLPDGTEFDAPPTIDDVRVSEADVQASTGVEGEAR